MGLYWDWKEKCGEAVFTSLRGQTVKVSLYEGNALLIMIHEFKEDNVERYSLVTFWADKAHMENCLGLHKKDGYGDNIYDGSSGDRLVEISINKKQCRNWKYIVAALAKAFDHITINIQSE